MKTNKIKPVGRPPIKTADKKQSFTVSLSIKRAGQLIKKYGSLSKALDTVEL